MPTPSSNELPPGRLAAALLEASQWFDEALLARLEQEGGPVLSPNRSRAFLAMSSGPLRVIELARQLDISRQAAHKLLDGLERDALVERWTDERDRRAQLVTLTDRGRDVARRAARILGELEAELRGRIGPGHVDALRRALAVDWGRSPR
ncbi:MarR family winged helix-turn-helix transcriptional regulator [Egicoccus sp. AB-alg6-2]|uniref:MarR family winged helix-turn-helix transcriptional regulator n=1 Tax=Egicoccus sp. AB-alg6-2 TaxID=3242692 RepID=UPI00359D9B33